MAATEIAALVGRNIRTARRAADLTQNELSREINAKGTMTVSNWENGKARPSDTYLVLLSEVLNHEPAWFFTDHKNADEKDAA